MSTIPINHAFVPPDRLHEHLEYSDILNDKKKALYIHNELHSYQALVVNYMAPWTPNKACVLCHPPGVGKTLTSIAVVESYRGSCDYVLVLVNNDTSKNNYERTIKMFFQLQGLSLNEKELKQKMRFYNIKKVREYAAYLASMKDEQIKEKHQKAFIVIDESHNIKLPGGAIKTAQRINLPILEKTGIEAQLATAMSINKPEDEAVIKFEQIVRLMAHASYKGLLLLSATLVYDNSSEFASTLKLLFPTRNIDLSELNKASFDHTPENILKLLPQELNGMISCYKGVANVPIRIIEGEKIVDGIDFGKKVVVSYMGEEQKDVYKTLSEKHPHGTNGPVNSRTSVYSDHIGCSLFAFEGLIGSKFSEIFLSTNENQDDDMLEGVHIEQTIKHKTRQRILIGLLKERLTQDFYGTLDSCACKIATMLRAFHKNSGCIYIYSRLLGGGIEIIATILDHLGYKKATDVDEVRGTAAPRYIVCTGDKSISNDNELLIDAFNQDWNKQGKHIQIVLGSNVITESLSLLHIRQIHVLTPHWNNSLITQTIGRAYRDQCHALLPFHERNIRIFHHIAMLDKRQHKRLETGELDMQELSKVSIDAFECVGSFRKDKALNAMKSAIESFCIERFLFSDDIKAVPSEQIGKNKAVFEAQYVKFYATRVATWLRSAFREKEIITFDSINTFFGRTDSMTLLALRYLKTNTSMLFEDKYRQRRVLFVDATQRYAYLTARPNLQEIIPRSMYPSPFSPLLVDCDAITPRITQSSVDVQIFITKFNNLNGNNFGRYELCHTLMKQPNHILVELFEFAWSKKEAILSLFKTFVFTLDNVVYHAIACFQPNGKANYNSSSVHIEDKSSIRKYLPEERQWVYIADQIGYLELGNTISNMRYNYFAMLMQELNIFIKLCIKDKAIRYACLVRQDDKNGNIDKAIQYACLVRQDDKNGKVDKRKCYRGRNETSINLPRFIDQIKVLITLHPALSLYLADLWRTKDPVQYMNDNKDKIQARKLCRELMGCYGLFMLA